MKIKINGKNNSIDRKYGGNDSKGSLKTENKFRRFVISFILSLIIVAIPICVNAQSTTFTVNVGTGRDDLRGGNRAFMSFVLTNGSVTAERLLSTGLNSNTNSTINVTFPTSISPTQIRSVRIRHDGSPRSGHPFDTYDKWDLRSLSVRLGTNVIYDSSRDSRLSGVGITFTGSMRLLVLPIRAAPGEADFIITQINRSPSGLIVTVSNIGLARGTVVEVECSAGSRFVERAVGIVLEPGSQTSVLITALGRPTSGVTCTVSGTNEAVTSNNVFRG